VILESVSPRERNDLQHVVKQEVEIAAIDDRAWHGALSSFGPYNGMKFRNAGKD
jgi:hypothetical protein